LIGGLLGIALTFPAGGFIQQQLKQFFPVFTISATTISLELLAAATVGVVAALFPTWRAATINIAEGLRRIG
jgi:putative ABC transport system permease protein